MESCNLTIMRAGSRFDQTSPFTLATAARLAVGIERKSPASTGGFSMRHKTRRKATVLLDFSPA